LRLAPLRPSESAQLDSEPPRDRWGRAGGREGELTPIPYIDWDEFLATFEFEQGQHITMVGATGSGKTTLALKLLEYREFMIVLATKNRDESLYPKLEAKGYLLTDQTDLDWHQTPKVIFRPKLQSPSGEAKEEQKEAFQRVLVDVFNEGGWSLYGDEIRYLADNLGLRVELETLWLQGRSNHTSMIVATQRPVSIPVIAFESATHIFLFRMTDKKNIDRASEFGGADVDLIRHTLPRLPRYEVLYVDTRSGEMLRTKVKL
jgi:DNA helicase HerA-like ATPase